MSDRWNNLTTEEKQALMALDENERIHADDPRRPMYDDLAERRYLVACPFTYETPHWTEYELDSEMRIEVLYAENAALRQQVDALSRALESDEYRALLSLTHEYQQSVQESSSRNLFVQWYNGDKRRRLVNNIVRTSRAFITATEKAKANAGAAGDGEAG